MIEYEVTERIGKGYVARIHKPILTPEERKAREEEAKKALVRFYKETRGK